METRTAPGRLYIVATPIGNAGDITVRALEVLAQVDLIAAEDTRHTGRLLARLGLDRPLISVHEHNEEQQAGRLVERLRGGETVALISDAGTPLVSDPGYRLVRMATEAGIAVVAVPGPSAVTAALSVSGLPTDRFAFEGFLPARAAGQSSRWQTPCTIHCRRTACTQPLTGSTRRSPRSTRRSSTPPGEA